MRRHIRFNDEDRSLVLEVRKSVNERWERIYPEDATEERKIREARQRNKKKKTRTMSTISSDSSDGEDYDDESASNEEDENLD